MGRRGLLSCVAALAFLVIPAFSAQADHADPDDIVDVLPPDAIPAITRPTFGDDSAGWLPDEARVVGVSVGGDARAYAIAILNWHEIVDDVVGGVAVAVTFCPLCGTGVAFERGVGGEELTFKVSGKLYKNDLVMYDTATGSLWSQILGSAITGPHHGTTLRVVTSTTISWGEWRRLHPDSLLLDRPRDADGSFLRDYAVNPYAGYESSDGVWFPQGNFDPYRVLEPKDIVLGVFMNKTARAYPLSVLERERAVNDVLGDTRILVTYARDTMKAWLRADRVFQPESEASVADAEGLAYDAVTGEGDADDLTEVPSVRAFWFAWYDFFPATTIYGYQDLAYRPPEAPPSPLVPAAVGGVVVALIPIAVWLRRRRS